MTNDNGTAGEYLVASELCRRGFVATTFTRNMPGFDILALSEKGSLRIQVKTVRSGEWSLNARSYVNFEEEKFEKGIQEVVGKKKSSKDEFFVFVLMSDYGKDRFFVVPKSELINLIEKNYSGYLTTKKGVRARNPKTTHTAITAKDIERYENKWSLLS